MQRSQLHADSSANPTKGGENGANLLRELPRRGVALCFYHDSGNCVVGYAMHLGERDCSREDVDDAGGSRPTGNGLVYARRGTAPPTSRLVELGTVR